MLMHLTFRAMSYYSGRSQDRYTDVYAYRSSGRWHHDRRYSLSREQEQQSSSQTYVPQNLNRNRPDSGSYTTSRSRPSDGHGEERRGRSEGVGIKSKDFAAAFIGDEKESSLQEYMPSQIQGSDGVYSDRPPSATVTSLLTPRVVVEEFKRSGHFDAIRKKMFTSFQSSEHKNLFLHDMEKLLSQRLRDLPSEKRRNLANKDVRLQHSELNGWLEDSPEVAKVIDTLFESLRGDMKGNTMTLLAHDDGALSSDFEVRLKESIAAESQRISSRTTASVEDSRKSTLFSEAGSDASPLPSDQGKGE